MKHGQEKKEMRKQKAKKGSRQGKQERRAIRLCFERRKCYVCRPVSACARAEGHTCPQGVAADVCPDCPPAPAPDDHTICILSVWTCVLTCGYQSRPLT